MFIARYPNGDIVNEKQITWNKIKDGMSIVELTLPMRVTCIDPETHQEKLAPARTISLRGFEKYYFHNEAVAHLDVGSGKIQDNGQGQLVAQAIGGIKKGQITEVRIDKSGFCQINVFDEEGYQHSDIKIAAKN